MQRTISSLSKNVTRQMMMNNRTTSIRSMGYLMRPISVSSTSRSQFSTGMRFYSDEAKNTEQAAADAAKATEAEEITEPTQSDEVADLKAQLERKDKEAAELKDLYIRSVADFRNLQETTKREIQKAKDFALQKFAKDLIESVDNFGHALNAVDKESISSNAEIKNLYDGFEMTKNIFVKTLGRHGVEEIQAIGEKFDPNRHEATFEVPQPDKEAGTVFHVQQPGYELNGRVLRAAKVGIVKGDD